MVWYSSIVANLLGLQLYVQLDSSHQVSAVFLTQPETTFLKMRHLESTAEAFILEYFKKVSELLPENWIHHSGESDKKTQERGANNPQGAENPDNLKSKRETLMEKLDKFYVHDAKLEFFPSDPADNPYHFDPADYDPLDDPTPPLHNSSKRYNFDFGKKSSDSSFHLHFANKYAILNALGDAIADLSFPLGGFPPHLKRKEDLCNSIKGHYRKMGKLLQKRTWRSDREKNDRAFLHDAELLMTPPFLQEGHDHDADFLMTGSSKPTFAYEKRPDLFTYEQLSDGSLRVTVIGELSSTGEVGSGGTERTERTESGAGTEGIESAMTTAGETATERIANPKLGESNEIQNSTTTFTEEKPDAESILLSKLEEDTMRREALRKYELARRSVSVAGGLEASPRYQSLFGDYDWSHFNDYEFHDLAQWLHRENEGESNTSSSSKGRGKGSFTADVEKKDRVFLDTGCGSAGWTLKCAAADLRWKPSYRSVGFEHNRYRSEFDAQQMYAYFHGDSLQHFGPDPRDTNYDDPRWDTNHDYPSVSAFEVRATKDSGSASAFEVHAAKDSAFEVRATKDYSAPVPRSSGNGIAIDSLFPYTPNDDFSRWVDFRINSSIGKWKGKGKGWKGKGKGSTTDADGKGKPAAGLRTNTPDLGAFPGGGRLIQNSTGNQFHESFILRRDTNSADGWKIVSQTVHQG